MTKPSFGYVIYIHATAEEVWRGLVDPEFTRRYGMHENVSDWEPGSEWSHKGVNGRWTDVLSKAQSREYEARAVQELGKECAQWVNYMSRTS